MEDFGAAIDAEVAKRMKTVKAYLRGEATLLEYEAVCELHQRAELPLGRESKKRRRNRNRRAERLRSRRYRARKKATAGRSA